MCCVVSVYYGMSVPRCNRLQLERFVIALSVELRNLHHPGYLDCHHWVVHFIWEHTHDGSADDTDSTSPHIKKNVC